MQHIELKIEAFESRLAITQALGYSNKCVPIALSMVLQMPVTKVIEAVDGQCKRNVGKDDGYYFHEYIDWFKSQLAGRGKRLYRMHLPEVRQYAKTTKTLTPSALSKLGIREGIVRCSGHLAGITEGCLLDWTDNRRKRILEVYKVIEV